MSKIELINTLVFKAVIKKNLSPQANDILSQLNVNDVEMFLSVSREQLSQVNCGEFIIIEILELQELVQYVNDSIVPYINSNMTEAENIDRMPFKLIPTSVRAYGILSRLGINNVRSFLNLFSERLSNTKHCGKKTVDEIMCVRDLLRTYLELTSKQSEKTQQPEKIGEELELTVGDLDKQIRSYRSILETMSYRASHVLQRNHIDTLEQFMALTKAQVRRFKNCGQKTIAEIECVQEKLTELLQTAHNILDVETNIPGGSVLPSELVFTNSDEEIKFYQAMIRTLSIRAFNVLEKQHVDTLEKFMALKREQMLRLKNCGRKTIDEIEKYQFKLDESIRSATKQGKSFFDENLYEPFLMGISSLNRLDDIEENILFDLKEPFDSLNSWVKKFCKSEKDVQVFLLRKGMMGAPPMTLEEIGERLNVTRERIRQRELKTDRMATAQQYRLKPLINRIKELVSERGGKLDKKTLVYLVLVQGNNKENLRYADDFIEFLSLLEIWKKSGLQLDEAGSVFINESIDLIDKISSVIVQIAHDNADEKLEAGLWSIDYGLLKKHLLDWHNNNNNMLLDISDAILNESLNRATIQLRRKKNRIYSLELYTLYFGKLIAVVETVLKRSSTAMHFTQVYQEAKRWHPMQIAMQTFLSERNVHATLDRCKNALLWDLGTFIHREKITIPYDLLDDVEIWLKQKLQDDIPFISAYRYFKEFEDKCCKAGITSEYALYTLLKEAGSPNFVYPRLPYVYLKQTYKDRLPLAIAIEQFLQEAGVTVSSSELKSFAIDGLGLKDFQYNQALAQVSNFVRTNKGGFLHTDYLEFNKELLQEVVVYAQQVVDKEGHVSVSKIFESKTISCKMAGVDSPEMLYSILQLEAEDMFDLSNYPQILAATKNQGKLSNSGVIHQVVNYIKNKVRPCSYSELEEHFVNKLGYSAQTVFSVVYNRNDIYRYVKGCLVHKDTIGWNGQKQLQLEQAAFDVYFHSVKANKCYATINSMIESSCLPELAGNICWTPLLLSDLLIASDKYKIIGTTRNAYVPSTNELGIRTFEDLVYELLNRDYGGATNLLLFEKTLRDLGIIIKSLTAEMLGESKKVSIIGKEILLTELVRNA